MRKKRTNLTWRQKEAKDYLIYKVFLKFRLDCLCWGLSSNKTKKKLILGLRKGTKVLVSRRAKVRLFWERYACEKQVHRFCNVFLREIFTIMCWQIISGQSHWIKTRSSLWRNRAKTNKDDETGRRRVLQRCHSNAHLGCNHFLLNCKKGECVVHFNTQNFSRSHSIKCAGESPSRLRLRSTVFPASQVAEL